MVVYLQEELKEFVFEGHEWLLERVDCNTWLAIRNLLKKRRESTISKLSMNLTKFDMMDEQTKKRKISILEDYARSMLEKKVREEAESGSVLKHMKDMYEHFCHILFHLLFFKILFSTLEALIL